jgi:hypothetical protein
VSGCVDCAIQGECLLQQADSIVTCKQNPNHCGMRDTLLIPLAGRALLTVRMFRIDTAECPSDILRTNNWFTILGGTVVRGWLSWDRVSWDTAVTENIFVSVMCKVEMVLAGLQHLSLLQ